MRQSDISSAQPSFSQIGPTEICTYQECPKQIRSTKISLMQVDSSQLHLRGVYTEFVAHVLGEPVLLEGVELLQVGAVGDATSATAAAWGMATSAHPCGQRRPNFPAVCSSGSQAT